MKQSLPVENPAARLRGKRVLILGDVMLDRYLTGEAERISPEAPVPVVRLLEEQCRAGGAGNVARNVAALGGNACLVSVAGDDEGGRTLQSLLAADGVATALPLLPGRTTTVKTRILASRQQLLRLDAEIAQPLTDEEEQLFFEGLAPLARQHEVLILSDYGKGLVNPSFMERLRALLHALPHPPLLLVDPRPQHMHLYQGAYLLTPNARECGDAAHMPVRSREEILAAGRVVLARSGCPRLLVTLGAQGMALFQESGEVRRLPTSARAVFDVTGAGDTVISTVALALAAGMPLLAACMLANFAAGIVVAQVGTATATPEQLADAVKAWPTPDLEIWT